MEDRNTRLIVAYFDKTIDDDGLAELKEWLESNQDNQEIFSETIQILSASKSYFVQPDKQASSWARIQAHLAAAAPVHNEEIGATIPASIDEPKRFQLNRWFVAAALVLVTSAASLIGYQYMSAPQVHQVAYAQFSNPNGSHSKIILPDSSVIHLGAGSKVRYEKSFTAAKREVFLDGEAFFEVTHHATRPFIVKSGKIATVVLGTSFNVKAFAAKHKVAVTVKTGKVGIMSNLNGKSQLLSYLLPDEQLEVNTQTGKFTSRSANAAAVSGWTDNHFVYYNTSLKDIAESLERHYAVNILFDSPQLAKIKLTAKFNNLPLGEVAENLSQLSGLSFVKKGNEITVSAHQQKRRKIMK